jgi:ribosomal protein S18 acetylase RimI-like enzyme
MTPAGLEEFLRRSQADYIADLVTDGMDEVTAAARADRQLVGAFPNGERGPGHEVFDVVEGDAIVGYVWLGPEPGTPRGCWWLWDIAVNTGERGRGLGTELLKLLEDEVKRRGGSSIGLNVFAHNVVAQRLYVAAGYSPAAGAWRKAL